MILEGIKQNETGGSTDASSAIRQVSSEVSLDSFLFVDIFDAFEGIDIIYIGVFRTHHHFPFDSVLGVGESSGNNGDGLGE